jgi:hypothetical protein
VRNFTIWSIVCLGAFAILFCLLSNGMLSPSMGKFFLVSVILLPLLGVIFGAISDGGLLKWVLILLNVFALGSIIFRF